MLYNVYMYVQCTVSNICIVFIWVLPIFQQLKVLAGNTHESPL